MTALVLMIAMLAPDDDERFVASDATKAAAKSAYKKRASAQRPAAIKQEQERAAALADSLAKAKRGKIDNQLVGTDRSAGVETRQGWSFGTEEAKSRKIFDLSHLVQLSRDRLAGLRSGKELPYLVLDWNGATLGATGFIEGPATAELIVDKSTVAARLRGSGIVILEGGEPQVFTGDPPKLLVIKGLNTAGMEPGQRIELDGIWWVTSFDRIEGLGTWPAVERFPND